MRSIISAPNWRSSPDQARSSAVLLEFGRRQHSLEDAVAPDKAVEQRRSDVQRDQPVDQELTGEVDRDRGLRQTAAYAHQRRNADDAEA